MLVRVADANSCFESTTWRQAAPAKKLRRQRLIAAGICETKSNSLLLFGLEAGEFLDQHIRVRTFAPSEGSHAGTERLGHRVELFAVGNVDDVGRSVSEIFRLVGLKHLIERRIKHELGDPGLRLPCVRRRVLALRARHYPNRVAAGLRD